MKLFSKITICLLVALMCLFSGFGYAAITGGLSMNVGATFEPILPDIYIEEVTPDSSAGVAVTNVYGTLFMARIDGSGTATFTIRVKNISEKIYVYERTIDGSEASIEGVYDGTEIKYEVIGMVPLDEVPPDGGARTFTLKITVPPGIEAENYFLKFNFMEKQDVDILPDGTDPEPDPPVDPDPEPDPDPDPEPDPDPDPEPDPEPPVDPEPDEPEDILYGDFRGLVEVLLDKDVNNSLNNSNMIYNAIMESLESNKRPDEDAPILHCHVNSVSGGTVTDLAMNANKLLTTNLHFIFEADTTDEDRLFIYMYYEEDCTKANTGKDILVYKQVVTRGGDGVWVKNGTYVGTATVGYFYGGGKNGKDVLTVNPYSWKYTAEYNEGIK